MAIANTHSQWINGALVFYPEGNEQRWLDAMGENVVKYIEDFVVTPESTAAATVAETMLDNDDDPQAIAERANLVQVSDSAELAAVLDEVLAANAKAVADASTPGKKQKKAFGFLLGQVMQKTRGQANPKVVNELLQKKIAAS